MPTVTDARDPDEYMYRFYVRVNELVQEAKDWRLGQIYSNVLSELDPVWASVMPIMVDPFHDDRKIPDMIAWLEDRLTRPDSSK